MTKHTEASSSSQLRAHMRTSRYATTPTARSPASRDFSASALPSWDRISDSPSALTARQRPQDCAAPSATAQHDLKRVLQGCRDLLCLLLKRDTPLHAVRRLLNMPDLSRHLRSPCRLACTWLMMSAGCNLSSWSNTAGLLFASHSMPIEVKPAWKHLLSGIRHRHRSASSMYAKSSCKDCYLSASRFVAANALIAHCRHMRDRSHPQLQQFQDKQHVR